MLRLRRANLEGRERGAGSERCRPGSPALRSARRGALNRFSPRVDAGLSGAEGDGSNWAGAGVSQLNRSREAFRCLSKCTRRRPEPIEIKTQKPESPSHNPSGRVFSERRLMRKPENGMLASAAKTMNVWRILALSSRNCWRANSLGAVAGGLIARERRGRECCAQRQVLTMAWANQNGAAAAVKYRNWAITIVAARASCHRTSGRARPPGCPEDGAAFRRNARR